jgi:kumamolisin
VLVALAACELPAPADPVAELGDPPAPLAVGRQHLQGHISPAMATARWLGSVERDRPLTITIGLPVRDPAGLAQAVEAVSDPNSPAYRQYVTPDEFAARYGADPAAYQKVIDWGHAAGLAVEAHANRLVAQVTGSAAELENALHVQLGYRLRPDGSRFFAPDREPSIDLDVAIGHISGLDDFVVPRRASGGSGSTGLLFGQDYRRAYASCSSMTGAGQSIGLLSLGDGVLASDITAYTAATGLTGVPAMITIGASGSGGDLEDTLDVEMAISMAPAAQVVLFRGDLNTALSHMANHPEVKQISSSYVPALDNTSRGLLAQLALQGQSFFQGSGDSGALNAGSIGGINDLRTQPSVTVVGGTELDMVSPGAAYSSETAWSGSSGGILSNVVDSLGVGTPIPSYQAGLATTANQASTAYRNIPDVSFPGDGVLLLAGGSYHSVGGTSVAAPLWAGFTALVNQSAYANGLGPIGAANPSLYLLARTSPWLFHDITVGSNPSTLPGLPASYNATPGYDLVTGLGTPSCSLIAALSSLSNLSSTPAVSARGPGVLEMFARQGSSVIHRTYRDHVGFGPWQFMPPVTATSAPASVSWTQSRIDMFVKGASNEILHAWWNDGSDWVGWEDLGCCFDTAPAVASWGPGRLDVFAVSGGTLRHKKYAGGWGPWENLGGAITSAPSAVSWTTGRIDVFAKGASNELTHTWYNDSTGWAGWFENLGGSFDSAPGVASWGPGRLDVFQGSGGGVWHRWYNGGWNGWEYLGGSVTSDLSATSWGVGRIDITARGTGNQMAHLWYNNATGWGWWEAL